MGDFAPFRSLPAVTASQYILSPKFIKSLYIVLFIAIKNCYTVIVYAAIGKSRNKRGIFMRKTFSRMAAAAIILLTAILNLFPATAGAVSLQEMDDNSVSPRSGVPYTYRLTQNRPYIKITVSKESKIRIQAQTDGKVSGYNSDTNFYLYDSREELVAEWNRYDDDTHVAVLDRQITLKPGSYYFWQEPFLSSFWGTNAVSTVTITYPGTAAPAPTTSPRITKISTGNKKAWVYWNGMTGATSYRVYVVQNGKERLAGTTKQTKFLVTGMTNGVRANYYVKAVINGRLSTAKNIAYSTPRNGVKPRLSVSSNRCVISWNKYQGATKYKIVAVDSNKKILAERVTTKTTFDWRGFAKGKKYGFYIVPFVGNDYIPFGRSYAEDQANISFFTAK